MNELILKAFFFFSKGIPLIVNGRTLVVKGAVLVMLADTQAAYFVGGFKFGVGFSLRRCRDCMATINYSSAIIYSNITQVAIYYSFLSVSRRQICSPNSSNI